jgi:glyoxylase-like metal-dependent hydrolase (beta-lactamase superfamily II)
VSDSPLYFRQLLGGRDFGRKNPVCGGMENFVYLVGDRAKGECVVIDPAWAVDELVSIAEGDGMKIVGALGTHYHPDHIGGQMMGMQIEGIARMLAVNPCPIHVHRADAEYVRHVTGLSPTDLALRDGGDKIAVGDVEIEWLHTPGHTPGSSCFRLKHALLAGDTVFLQGCGRVDLPGGDKDEMERTLTQRLASLPADMILYPGHNYGGSHAPLGEVRKHNPMLNPDFFRRMR